MAVSMRDLDPAFQGAGQKAGLEIWHIKTFRPELLPKSSHGKFFTADSYVILKTTALKSGTLRHDIHYWLGKDTSQDEAGVAAIKTIELDATLGGRAVQYREIQGHETEKFLSYFKPCIMPLEGGVASGFKHVEAAEHKTMLYVCKGKHVVHVKEVPFARSTLNHEDVFLLDTKSKIFQFNGSNSSIQERAKALEVVQYIKDTFHAGKCDIAAIEDGKLMADADTGEFWTLFGGFAPLPRKTASADSKTIDDLPTRLLRVEKGKAVDTEADSIKRELLETSKCYILDCGAEVYIWMGRNTSLEERKTASGAAEEIVDGSDRPKSHIIRVIEGFETVIFRSKFDSWPQSATVAVSEDGRGKVAALLKRQGVDVKGLLKAAPAKEEEPEPHIDCTGNLQVWRVNGQSKTLLPEIDQSKLYSGDCYIFQYSYPGNDKEENLIGTWFGKQSVEEDRMSATSQANKMVESMKCLPAQARIYEGNEPVLFFSIFQSLVIFKGGLSDAYKKYIAENELPDETYSEEGVALFRVQGSGPENMQAIQLEPVASSLNSSYCYIVHNDSLVFSWFGNLTTSDSQELLERQLDLIKPNMQSRPQKEGSESEQFWELLGEKCEYSSQKVAREAESDPHLFSCTFSKGDLKVTEIYNFNQDDLMTEDIFIINCHSEIFIWVGQQVDSKNKKSALNIGEKFVEQDFLFEKLSSITPLYVVMEGSEPSFFTRFFTWDSAKSAMHGNSFQRKLAIVKNEGKAVVDKPKRRTIGGRSAAPEKSQRSRSVTSFSSDRTRPRGRSPAFNALAANFESPNSRNLSTPPPVVSKIYPKSGNNSPDSSSSTSSSISSSAAKLASRSKAIAALTAGFESSRSSIIPGTRKVSLDSSKQQGGGGGGGETNSRMGGRIESLTIEEDVKEGEAEDEEGLTTYPYERLQTFSSDPVTDIDVTKRETYLSTEEFGEKFGMSKDAFYKLPKWKQNKMKMTLQLF